MSKKVHQITNVESSDKFLFLSTETNRYQVAWSDCSSKLAQATKFERCEFEVSPSGYGIHWHLLDEDLAITPLLENAKTSRSAQSYQHK